jgi:putative phosphoribosyl transferase
MFRDRTEAGVALGRAVRALIGGDPALRDPVVLALPRGGVPVAAEVARALGAPLDLLLVRKIGAPGNPELAVAAVVEGDPPDLAVNRTIQRVAGVTDADLDAAKDRQLSEIARRRALYLQGRPPTPITGRTAVLVDDGVATGATMRAALTALRRRGPAAVILAIPVAPADVLDDLRREATHLVCLETPEPFIAVGAHYADFDQVSDAEVAAVIRAASQSPIP